MGTNSVTTPQRFVDETSIDAVLLAGRWSLLDRTGLAFLDSCLRGNVSVVVGGVFNSGLLADPRGRATFDYAPASAEFVAAALRLEQLCLDHNTALIAAAIQFPFRHPAVVSVLTGVRSVAELESNVAAFDFEVPNELWPLLDEVVSSL